ncbi:hypothetical protein ACN47E_004027 [Coniothyrium glycines]
MLDNKPYLRTTHGHRPSDRSVETSLKQVPIPAGRSALVRSMYRYLFQAITYSIVQGHGRGRDLAFDNNARVIW